VKSQVSGSAGRVAGCGWGVGVEVCFARLPAVSNVGAAVRRRAKHTSAPTRCYFTSTGCPADP